jgi:hypothetical protein
MFHCPAQTAKITKISHKIFGTAERTGKDRKRNILKHQTLTKLMNMRTDFIGHDADRSSATLHGQSYI